MEPQQCWHLLAVVAYSLKPVEFLAQQVPTFLLFCYRRSVAQQYCVRLHGTPTMLASGKRLRTRLEIFSPKKQTIVARFPLSRLL